jgi:hypothetical protein
MDDYAALREAAIQHLPQPHLADLVQLLDEVNRANALAVGSPRTERYRNALSYISRPTMGLPGNADPAEFALYHAKEGDVRMALATCIRMAQEALRTP